MTMSKRIRLTQFDYEGNWQLHGADNGSCRRRVMPASQPARVGPIINCYNTVKAHEEITGITPYEKLNQSFFNL